MNLDEKKAYHEKKDYTHFNSKEVDGVIYRLKKDSDENPFYVARQINRQNDSTNVNIISEIDGIPVKKVASCLINDNEKVEYIKVPDSVEEFSIGSIDERCPLKTIELPEGLKVFRYTSFDDIKKIEIKGNCHIIPEEFTGNANKEINKENTFLKVLNKEGKCVGVTWHGEYIRSDDKKSIKYINFIKKDKTISLDAEKKCLEDKKIKFDENDLTDFNKIIKLIYPKLDDIPLPVPDFGSLFVNFKEWKDFGLDIHTIYDNPKIIFKNHSEMFDNIYENYSLLCSQNNITSLKMLQKIYFGFEFDSKEEFVLKLDNSIKTRGKFEPNTVIKLMDDSKDDLVKQKLKDSLVYASTVIPLSVDNIDSMSMIELREIIAQDVFENIAKLNDESYIDLYGPSLKKYSLSENGEDFFKGAHYHIRKDLEKINPNFYRGDVINLSDSEVFEFLKTLNTIKNWDKLSIDKKKRATLLKNEVIGRVLYATIRTAIESDISGKHIKEILSETNFDNIDLNECKDLFMKNLFYTDFKDKTKGNLDSKIINKMITLNPYTFDMLRDGKKIEECFYKVACDNDYLFRDQEDLNIIKNMEQGPKNQKHFSVIAQYMLNDIENNPKSDKFNAIFAFNIRRMLDEYFYSNNGVNNEFLFNVFRGLDVYLRKKSSIDCQEIVSRNVKRIPKELFDVNVGKLCNEIFDLKCQDKYNNYDRLCYSLFNLNRLAHDIHNISMRKIELDFNKYKNNSLETVKLNTILKSYEKLSRFGLMPEDVNFLFQGTKDFANVIVSEEFSNTDKAFLLNSILPGNVKKLDLALLAVKEDEKLDSAVETDEKKLSTIISCFKDIKAFLLNRILHENVKKLDSAVETDEKLDSAEEKEKEKLNTIISCFKDIMDVKDDIRKQIVDDVNEQRMNYDAKRVVGEIFVRMLSEFASKSLDNQKEFFKKYGFVVECQHDAKEDGNDLLVVYNPKFGNTFSVHMIDMDDDIKNIFDIHRNNDQTRTLCCTQVNGGLVRFEQAVIDKEKELIELSPSEFANSCDYPDRNLLNASVQFHNFLEYDCEVYNERIANANGNQEELKRVVLEIFDRVPIKNFDEVNIKKENGDGSYSSTKILSLISDKIGIRLDIAINTVNDIMNREENKEIVKFDDNYAGLVVHCLEQLNKKFLIDDDNYQKKELSDMMHDYFLTDTDVVSENIHI